MTTTELKKTMKEALDTVDKGGEILVTRKGSVYKIVKVG